MEKTRVCIIGCAGRMGRALLEAVYQSTNAVIGAAIETPGNEVLGLDAGQLIGPERLGVPVVSSLASVVDSVDVIIDFSEPSATLAHGEIAAQSKVPMIVGTTGFSSEQKKRLHALSERIPLVISSNYSIGVNLLFRLLREAAAVMGDEADIEIIEAHHRFKIDAPSGTALSMGEEIAKTLGRDLQQHAVYGREGITGERDPKTIGFSTIRAGDIVGDHKVLFATLGERIEISHKASNRLTFAAGAVRAACWVVSQPQRVYDMQDVLGFNKG
ncbi:4-hydroxy-tetrahydrodipicolinate reductase [Dongshaea marina]|uniref:4-hydroxy-tetrahydrodipicolinate reductase n=1 Tax=Dongshaea marina TaxID=2047966 RepID=UPI000D3E54F6|nr:4-hydroxy-tetrahydrodipicolinate reductase [Dongshaea marina]